MRPAPRPIGLVALPPSAALTATPRGSSAAREVPPDLPAADVVRLTEGAWLDEGKLARPDPLTGLRRAIPAAAEAESLHSYDAIHYRLDVTLSRTSNLVTGTMTLDLNVVDPGITYVDLFDQGLNVLSTRINGVARTFIVSGGKLLIPVCQGADCPPHGGGDPLQVTVDYTASPPAIGCYFYARNSYTMAEPYDARYWWPCYDLPNDKATLDVYATAPDSNVCVSNGVLVSVVPGTPGNKV